LSAIQDWLTSAARDAPDARAVVDPRDAWTFSELAAMAAAFEGDLAARGVAPGDRVVVLSRNRVEFVALLFATAAVGAISLPVNWRLTATELAWILEDAAPALVYAEAELAHLVGAREFLPIEGVPQPHRAGRAGSAPASSADVALQMYTSGTSGRPKGARLTHGNWTAMVASWLEDMDTAEGDRFLQVTPLFHVGGVLMAFSCVASRATLHLLAEFDPVLAADALEAERITHTLMVPAMIEWFLSEPGSAGRDYSALRLVVYGAAPMRVATLRRAHELLGAEFLQGYGLTESAGVLLVLRPEDHRRALREGDDARLACAGRPVSCAEVRLVDEDGREVPQATAGEVVARGANVTPGYWRDAPGGPDADGWFATGDVGVADAEGYVAIVDRIKDMVLVGGENVYPREVERVLLELDGVEDAAVIGVPHEVWGEAVLALVVAPGADAAAERRWMRACRSRLARFKCPVRIEVRHSLPRNAAGKLLKRELRAPYWEGIER